MPEEYVTPDDAVIPENEVRVPVYLITGFLESGKTSFIDFTIAQDYFEIDDPTLLINTEEGEESYDPRELLKHGTLYAEVQEKEELTYEKLVELDKKYKPGRVLIEYNPLWSIPDIENMKMPEGWAIVQEIVTVDASTFQIYQQNMKSLFVEMSRNADMVMFNRCTKDMPLANYRRSIKVVNQGCEVIFEDTDQEMIDLFEDSMPYELDADPIEIDDVDYGIFYIDLTDHPDRYVGKNVRFKGRVLKSRNDKAKFFVPGRQAMTCCADDMQFIGYICMYEQTPNLKMGEWVEVTAKVDWRYMNNYKEEGPVFIASEVRPAEAPASDLVYFS